MILERRKSSRVTFSRDEAQEMHAACRQLRVSDGFAQVISSTVVMQEPPIRRETGLGSRSATLSTFLPGIPIRMRNGEPIPGSGPARVIAWSLGAPLTLTTSSCRSRQTEVGRRHEAVARFTTVGRLVHWSPGAFSRQFARGPKLTYYTIEGLTTIPSAVRLELTGGGTLELFNDSSGSYILRPIGATSDKSVLRGGISYRGRPRPLEQLGGLTLDDRAGSVINRVKPLFD
ncbi:MAG: hypothetical protein JWN86_3712 [Planctomycetota bacterium]|nr:hypothetical protein [Planctomycetota bacterium]